MPAYKVLVLRERWDNQYVVVEAVNPEMAKVEAVKLAKKKTKGWKVNPEYLPENDGYLACEGPEKVS